MLHVHERLQNVHGTSGSRPPFDGWAIRRARWKNTYAASELLGPFSFAMETNVLATCIQAALEGKSEQTCWLQSLLPMVEAQSTREDSGYGSRGVTARAFIIAVLRLLTVARKQPST